MDYPHLRQAHACPLCHDHKEAGLVVCWNCYRARDLRYGNPQAEALIHQAEVELSGQVKAAERLLTSEAFENHKST